MAEGNGSQNIIITNADNFYERLDSLISKKIEGLKEMLEECIKKTEPEYYPPVENLLDLIYEHYTENNPVEGKTQLPGKQQRPRKRSWKSG